MTIYRCFVHGTNFPGALIENDEPVGFYATRWVEADSPAEAEMKVLELLRVDPSLNVDPKLRTQDAKVFFESIDPLKPGEEQGVNKGFTFYTD